MNQRRPADCIRAVADLSKLLDAVSSAGSADRPCGALHPACRLSCRTGHRSQGRGGGRHRKCFSRRFANTRTCHWDSIGMTFAVAIGAGLGYYSPASLGAMQVRQCKMAGPSRTETRFVHMSLTSSPEEESMGHQATCWTALFFGAGLPQAAESSSTRGAPVQQFAKAIITALTKGTGSLAMGGRGQHCRSSAKPVRRY
jgi:hypothetical protein